LKGSLPRVPKQPMLRSRSSRAVVAVAVAAIAAVVTIAFVTLLRGGDKPTRAAQPDSGRASRIKEFVARHRDPALTRGKPSLPPSLPGDVTDVGEVPDLFQVDRRYPGLSRAYQASFELSRARSLKRASRRCLATLPDNVKEVRWDTLESFELSEDGKRLVRTEIQVIPGTMEQSPFTACFAKAIDADGEFSVEVPEGAEVAAPVLIRNEGVIYLNDDISAEYVEQELSSLRERLGASSVNQKAAIQDQIDLYECYRQLGVARKRECLSR
jgi:hypothetical protein